MLESNFVVQVELGAVLGEKVSVRSLPVAEGDELAIIGAAVWIAGHVEYDLAFLFEHFCWNVHVKAILIVVAQESHLNLLVLRLRVKVSFDVFENGEWSTIPVDARHLDLVVGEGDLGPPVDLELWNRHFKLLHELGEHGLNSGVDDQVSHFIQWRLLEIDHDELAAGPFAGHWNSTGWVHSAAGADAEHEVGCDTGITGVRDNILIELLIKVDNGIIQLAIALLVFAHAGRFVMVVFLLLADAKVPHVVLAAFAALLQVCVSMKLEDFSTWDATLAVEAIDVLRNDVF